VAVSYPLTLKNKITEHLKLEGTHKDHQVQLPQVPAGKTIVLEPVESNQENRF